MTVALRSPQLIEALIPVDSAPVDAALQTDFHSYIKGMKKIEEAKLKKQTEADEILREYEEVSLQDELTERFAECVSPLSFDNSSLRTLFATHTAAT